MINNQGHTCNIYNLEITTNFVMIYHNSRTIQKFAIQVTHTIQKFAIQITCMANFWMMRVANFWMAQVMITTKWRFVLLFILEVCTASCVAVNNTESGILQWIQRRHSSDFYHFTNSATTHSACGEEKNTYLISENQCVNDQELFSGKIN